MRKVGPEAAKNYLKRQRESFFEHYLSGTNILDIGYKGGTADAVPITESAIGVELDYPGYDGKHLPFPEASQDAIFASHCLEHISDYRSVLSDWYRVLKIGGYLLIMVPHRDLYERKSAPPSKFNPDHKRFYTPASLLAEIEEALPVAGFRVRSLKDLDDGFDYSVPPEHHAIGSYEIELVLQKITIPYYAARLRQSPEARELLGVWGALIMKIAAAEVRGDSNEMKTLKESLVELQLPPFLTLTAALKTISDKFVIEEKGIYSLRWFRSLLSPVVAIAPFDENFYILGNPDVAKAVETCGRAYAREHYVLHGYYESRVAQPGPSVFD